MIERKRASCHTRLVRLDEKELSRNAALSRVMAQRARGRSRSAAVRALIAAGGLLIALAAFPLVIVLPELGIPALLLALRLLAVEFDRAAHSYAWVVWRWGRVTRWYRTRSRAVRAAVIVGLLAIAACLLWLLAHEL